MNRSHNLSARSTNPTADKQAIKADSFVAKRIALVHADHRGRKPFYIFSRREPGPGQRVAGVEGLDPISHRALITPYVDENPVVLNRGGVLCLRPFTRDIGTQCVESLD